MCTRSELENPLNSGKFSPFSHMNNKKLVFLWDLLSKQCTVEIRVCLEYIYGTRREYFIIRPSD